MTANPLPAALLPVAPAPGAGGTVASGMGPGEGPNASEFAALLQDASAMEPAPADERSEASVEIAPEGAFAEAASGSAFDGLLFLAALNPPPAALTLAPQVLSRSGAGAPAEGSLSADGSVVVREGVAVPGLEGETEALGRPDARGGKSTGAQFIAASTQAATRDERQTGNGQSRVSDAALRTSDAGRTAALPLGLPIAPTVEGARPGPESASFETPPGNVPAGTESTPLPASASAQARSPVAVDIDTPVHDPAWRAEAMGRIASLVTRGVDHAQLRLSPADLGPVEVRIDVRGGETTLAIVATQATTRDALEQALPLLREMLSQQGLSLGEASVQDGRADGGPNRDEAGARAGSATRFGAPAAETPVAARAALIRRLVDVFV